MHPLIARPRRLLLYLSVWTWFAINPAAMLASREVVTFLDGLLISLPPVLGYSVLLLPVWYVCRANPIRGGSTFRALLSHGIASVLFALAWRAMFEAFLRTAEATGRAWTGLAARAEPVMPSIFLMGVICYLLAAGFYYILLAVEANRAAERQESELRVLAGKAELVALRAQLNPHFLFNSLNSISALTTADPSAARAMCVRLADFLRLTMGLGERTAVPLKEELRLLDIYLSIEKVRLGDRLLERRTIDPAAESCLVPPLILQPLVENAVLHGVSTLSEGGTLALDIERRGDRLRVQLANPYDPDAPRRKGGGRGVENVRRRLVAHFGNDGRVSTEAKDGRFTVVVSVPAVETEES